MIAALLLAWLVHELGHWLMLRRLGLGSGLRNRWVLGVAMEMDIACQGWREAVVAAAGPAANLLLLTVCRAVGWQTGFEANFVMAAVNMLPFLPLDGGKLLRALLSGVMSWQRVTALLLVWGQGAALAFAMSIWYFGLQRWLLLLAGWLYLVALRERQCAPFVAEAALAACVGQRLRPYRIVNVRRDMPVYQAMRLLSPGWRNWLCCGGRLVDGDRLVRDWLAGGGSQTLGVYFGDPTRNI